MSAQSTANEEPLSPGAGPSKAISVAESENLSPNSSPRLEGKSAPQDSSHVKHHRVSSAKRVLARPTLNPSRSSLQSTDGTLDFGSSPKLISEDESAKAQRIHTLHHPRHHHSSHIIAQVADWLKQEKAKQGSRRLTSYKANPEITSAVNSILSENKAEALIVNGEGDNVTSLDESGAVDLERLEQILAGVSLSRESLPASIDDRKASSSSHRSSFKHRHLRRGSTLVSSDTDYLDGDAVVPSAEVVLDNSKTLSYSGGAADSEVDSPSSNKRAGKERAAWLHFKNEIVRLTHTLKLKGWRRVPLDRGGDIDVERISGALTNAVYMVSPPDDLPETVSGSHTDMKYSSPRKITPPPKLLLRIYGPQVEHLIDREAELQILRRLRRKKIGPNLLGTFINGRFEQFFHARTLTAKDLRVPQTSRQIAKRMRELHDGVELLEEERDAGPFVWQNWDKWVKRCEEVTTWLDHQILLGKPDPANLRSEKWKKRGLVCGVEWAEFRKAVDRYRLWLEKEYGGTAGVRQQLVFAHNDTQYGNLLRLNPPGESPLLIPANEHKQLIVIDFEYASANLPGLEFANHFSEWCYNYHNASKSYAFNALAYPTPDEQHRFLKAYIQHRPFVSSTPTPTENPSSSASSFILDSRAPQAQIAEEEKIRDQATEAEIQRFQHDARLWRAANSAMWVAWGIVQAKVAGMNEALEAKKKAGIKLDSDPLSPETQDMAKDAHDKRPDGVEVEIEAGGEEDQEEEEFDYLGYSQDRAMFFWGDVLQLGIVKKEDFSAEFLEKVKVVEY